MTHDENPVPPSLASIPNVPYAEQTLEQLKLERDYWKKEWHRASGFSSAKLAHECFLACERWIKHRESGQ